MDSSTGPPAQFSHQVTRLQFPKDVHFGDDISMWIAKVGDVALGNMYLRVDWPVAASVDDSTGTRMIEFVELRYENDLLERHYGESLELMNDLTVTTGKQPVLTTLVGKGLTSNLSAYYIRMPFRLNLPLCALDKAPVFRVKFRASQEFSTLNWTAAINVNLFVDYVYVTKAERDYFKTAKIDYLTHTIQSLQFTVGANITKSSFLTEFTRPVKELYWVIQTDGSAAYDYTNIGAEQLVSLRLQFNGVDVIPVEIGTPLFLRTIQGLENHTRVPDRQFYMYTFALDPEHPTQPTGSVNMSTMTRQMHTLELSSCAYSRQIRVYAVTHNVVRIADGAATSLFDTVQEGGTTLAGLGELSTLPTAGSAQWATRIGGIGDEIGSEISVDGSGNSYVVGIYGPNPATIYNADGTTFGTLVNSGSFDVYIVKYNKAGTAQWATRIAGSTVDAGYGISVDDSGNSYVTGYYDSNPVTIYNSDGSTFGTLVNSGFSDTFIVKYNTSGTAQWATRIADAIIEYGYGISVDDSGNVYVTGTYGANPATIYNADGSTFGTLVNSGSVDVFVVKYNTSGTAQWATRIAGSTIDIGYGISVDRDGNVYVTGYYNSIILTIYNADTSTFGILPNSGSYDAFIVKYNTSGTAQWATHIGGTGNDPGYDISVDRAGNSYVTGYYGSNPVTIYNAGGSTFGTLLNSGINNAYIVKYNTYGIAQWATRIAGSGNVTGDGISVDGSGNSYVTGAYDSNMVTIYNADGSTFETLTNSGFYDVFVVKYNTSGMAQWATRIGGTTSDIGYGISFDISGNVYVTGVYEYNPVTVYNADGSTFETLTNSGFYDTFIVKYSS